VSTISNACVGGHQAVGLAADLIASGQADAMIVLGHETPLVPEVFQLYSSDGSNVLAAPEGPPTEALKPYDSRRDGFVLGEGAVAVVLESERSARNRGAHAYARVLASTTINEAAHATRMDLTGESTAELIRGTALRSGVPLEEIDYVCGHGTGTRYNDLSESRALRLVYGEGEAVPPLGSIKPIFGHLLGASGVLNCVASALMLDRQCLVPTLNCVEVDPECVQDHVQEGPRRVPLRNILSLSFAIGSQSSALLLEAA
jgi:3-oxoacyl-[acyl-carrier-protein] synthase II